MESDATYQEALKAVAMIQQPVLDKISAEHQRELKEFLQAVKEVRVNFHSARRAISGTASLL